MIFYYYDFGPKPACPGWRSLQGHFVHRMFVVWLGIPHLFMKNMPSWRLEADFWGVWGVELPQPNLHVFSEGTVWPPRSPSAPLGPGIHDCLPWLGWLACCALPWSGMGLSCLPCLAFGGRLLLLQQFKARQARQAQARPSQGKAQQASQPSQGDVPVFLRHRHMVGKLCKIMKSGICLLYTSPSPRD